VNPAIRHVAVVGGGLAGMSAAVALAVSGYRVTLIEKRAALGGRAGSQLDPATGEWIDNCQHILMPCCTNLLDFYRRIGVRDRIRFYSRIPFIDLQGRVSHLKSSPLPAPLHSLPSLLTVPFLGPREKFGAVRGLLSLWRLYWSHTVTGATAAEWLDRSGQSRRAVEMLWQPLLVSALNDTLDHVSASFAAKVVVEAFLSNSRGWWLGIPTVPLGVLYGEGVARALESRGGALLLRTELRKVEMSGGRASALILAGGSRIEADDFLLAVPWFSAPQFVPVLPGPGARGTHPELESTPITGIHLWFGQPVTELDFAVLPGREVHWFFNKYRNYDAGEREGSYLQLVTSASRSWSGLGKQEILERALRDLRGILPRTRTAPITKARVLKEPAATFSPGPLSDSARPGVCTAVPNLYLAGDWIQTGWPSTMESAVRAGHLAANAILSSDGRQGDFLSPDLRPSGLLRLTRRVRS
jgi:squalene-associated FAD-dependent desaturase